MRVQNRLMSAIFGLVFAGLGIFFFYVMAWPFWQEWYPLQQWQPAEAELLSVSGDANQTRARYRYQFNGHTFQGARVYIRAVDGRLSSYHSDLLIQLRSQLDAGEPVSIWVNPVKPSQAIIDRDLRWGRVALVSGFCLSPIALGLGILYLTFRPNKKAGAHTGIGWQARAGWDTPNIRSDAMASTIMAWIFAIVFSAASVLLLFFIMPEALGKGEYVVLIFLAFPLAAVYLLYQAAFPTLGYWRFGQVLFEMDPFPGAIGGHVGGRVHVSRLRYNTAVNPSAKLSVRLECVYSSLVSTTVATGTTVSNARSRVEKIKWTEEGQPQCEMAKLGVSLAFRFDVPDDLPAADVEQGEAYHFWRLTVKASIRGIDLHRRFEIPVFQTGEMSRHVGHNISTQMASRKDKHAEALKDAITEGKVDLPHLPGAMRMIEDGEETRLFFHMFRSKKLAFFIALPALGFCYASFLLIGRVLTKWDLVQFLKAIPFSLGAIVLSSATIYMLINTLSVYIRPGHLRVDRHLLFFRIFSRQLSAPEISHLRIKWTSSTTRRGEPVTFYIVLAHDQAGKPVTIAEGVEGQGVAANFCDYLAQRLGVESRIT